MKRGRKISMNLDFYNLTPILSSRHEEFKIYSPNYNKTHSYIIKFDFCDTVFVFGFVITIRINNSSL